MMAKKPTENDLAREAAVNHFADLEPTIRHLVKYIHVRREGVMFECSVGMQSGIYLPAGYFFVPEEVGAL